LYHSGSNQKNRNLSAYLKYRGFIYRSHKMLKGQIVCGDNPEVSSSRKLLSTPEFRVKGRNSRTAVNAGS
jgi:hypothetical protein